jgi:hypothetical protein
MGDEKAKLNGEKRASFPHLSLLDDNSMLLPLIPLA